MNHLSAFKLYLEAKNYSPATVRNYIADTGKYLHFAQNKNIFSPDTLHAYITQISSNNNAKRYLASLKKFCQFAQSQQFYSGNLFRDALQNKKTSPQLENYLLPFKTYLTAKKRSSVTIKNYINDLNQYIIWFKDEKSDTNNNYSDFLQSQTLSPSSISRKLSSLATFKKFLVKKGYITPVILNSVQNPSRHCDSVIANPPLLGQLSIYTIVALLLIIISGLGYGIYSQTILKAKKQLAYTTASNPQVPSRFLSFQGRLTDSFGNPISSSTGILFKLYNAGTGGTELYNSNVGNSQAVVPDDDGIFNVIIGKTHGTEIPNSVFTENTEVWLEITTDSETMTPRQQIATVAYALNSETLQGLPPSASGMANTVMVLDASGNINLGETSPSIISTSGTFGIEGQAMLLKATDGSGGSITINPDAAGIINLMTEGAGSTAVGGFINLTNANLATGNLINASIGNASQAYNFLEFNNFAVGTTGYTTRFSVGASGNVTLSGSLSIGNTLITASATQINYLAGIGSTNGSIVITTSSNRFNNLAQGGSGQLLQSNGADQPPSWISQSAIGASTVPFAGITTGTNTQALMTVGAGSSLTYSGTGIINANRLAGLAYDNLPYVTNTTNTTLTRTGAGPYTLALNLGSTNTWTAPQTFSNHTYFPGSGIWNTS
ncbi:site-specific integrase, partial [Patescibacteria group bacterium]|nr:site-specific integrase [Patescibacteria group bacterium]